MGLFNPFPGLRPFEADEEHLFFGRETETDDLLRRLRTTRFLAVVGASGSGKSSLVRSGLIPSLQAGALVGASSSWRIAVFRPGGDPLGHLAAALAHPDVLGSSSEELSATNAVLIEATLGRGGRGLVDATRQAAVPKGHSLLVLVDQFEEIFRFRTNEQIADSRDEAMAFVRLLLEAAEQRDLPIYVALTMRSDFIGDCANFPGLSETVNAGLYLVGRMSRDALRLAITGPVAVGGGTIAPRLVHRVLNDLGDDHDQLPIVQHALMRTWEQWAATGATDRPIDIEDYEAIGTLSHALSQHADEAYAEMEAAGNGALTQSIFKALTDAVSDARGVRRPTSVGDLAAITRAPEADVVRVVDAFRRPGRSFLMPPSSTTLTSRSIVDLAHESLMRCWPRLLEWANEERDAAEFYQRLARAAVWHADGKGGLWRNPELELADEWQRRNAPTADWARRYGESFDLVMTFLAESLEERRQLKADRQRQRKAHLRRAQWAAVVLGGFLIVASALAYLAWRESQRAQVNLELAKAAVDDSLSSVDRNTARVGADAPQLEELRRDLLAKAQTFYAAFMQQEPSSPSRRRDVAMAHFRMGHISRLLDKPAEAEADYRQAITRLQGLASSRSGLPEDRAALANAYNWLGETLRPNASRAADAEQAYGHALTLQKALVDEEPKNVQVRREFARSHYNRGILRAEGEGKALAAEADFRDAIRLLEPIAASDVDGSQELARAYNNLGSLLADNRQRMTDARPLWEKAIAIDEAIIAAHPGNREVKSELATFCANLAGQLQEEGDSDGAEARSREALRLVETLARLPPSMAVTLADAHSLRGTILETRNAVAADREFSEALDLFVGTVADPAVRRRPDYHLRFGDLLLGLAASSGRSAGAGPAGVRLTRAVSEYARVAGDIAANGSAAEAQLALDTIARVLPSLPANDRADLTMVSRQLAAKVGGSK